MSRPAPRPLPPFWVMAAALVAVAGNLRVAITSVPPLLSAISADLGLSYAAAGALTTLPVLCMGLFAPVASAVAHRVGAVAAVLGASACIVAGTASRLAGGSVAVLYAGTFVAGVGIAVAGLSIYTTTAARAREYAVLRALGLRARSLYALVLRQALLTVALALALSLLMLAVLAQIVPSTVPLVLTAPNLARAAAITLAIGLLASLFPIRRLIRVEPASVYRRA